MKRTLGQQIGSAIGKGIFISAVALFFSFIRWLIGFEPTVILMMTMILLDGKKPR